MKVLNGMSEVAGQGIYTVKGLLANGVVANMVVWSRNTNGYETDIDLKIDKYNYKAYPLYACKMLKFAINAFFKYDILHSHAGYTLVPFNLDAIFIKKTKFRIFAEFHGSEIRNLFNDIQYDFFSANWDSEKVKKKQQKRILRMLKASSGIIVHDYELLPHIPKDVVLPVYIVPLRIEISKFVPYYPKANVKKVKIVHAPSKRSTKGTDTILNCLKYVKGDYELVLVEGKTQDEAFKIYEEADIIIDQISVGTYGVFAVEAMALGKPVITFIDNEIKNKFPDDLPIVSSDFQTLPKVLDDLISDGKKRYEIGVRGRKYVERYHDNCKVTKYLKDIYDGTIAEADLFKVL